MAGGGEPALLESSKPSRGEVCGFEALVFDGSDEVSRYGAQPAVGAGLRDGMQPQAGRDPGAGLMMRELCPGSDTGPDGRQNGSDG